MQDSDVLNFGASNDLKIYHDGSNSYILEEGTGNLIIDSNQLFLRNASTDNVLIETTSAGAVLVKYNGSTKLETTSTGVTVTGDVTIDDKIIHSGDTNTAIRFPAADTVAVETAGSERLRIGSSGQIGLGGANYGTSSQVLTSNGSSSAPTWQDAAGGAWNLISTVNASGASTVNLTGIDNTYSSYCIKVTNATWTPWIVWKVSCCSVYDWFYSQCTICSSDSVHFQNKLF